MLGQNADSASRGVPDWASRVVWGGAPVALHCGAARVRLDAIAVPKLLSFSRTREKSEDIMRVRLMPCSATRIRVDVFSSSFLFSTFPFLLHPYIMRVRPPDCSDLKHDALSWESWLIRPPDTREIPSSSLGESRRTFPQFFFVFFSPQLFPLGTTSSSESREISCFPECSGSGKNKCFFLFFLLVDPVWMRETYSGMDLEID